MIFTVQVARLAVTVLILIILMFLGCRNQVAPTTAPSADIQRAVQDEESNSNVEENAQVDDDQEHAAADELPLAHPAQIQIDKQMMRPAPLAGGTGAVYFWLHNGSDREIRFVGADSPVASAIELHTTENDNGIMRMRQITDGVLLRPGELIQLTPGSMHLMLVDLARPLAEGESVEITLHFEGAEDFTFQVPVVGMDDLPAEDEAEHDH